MSGIRSVKRIIKEIKYILTSKQRKSVVWVSFSMFICSCLELLGVTVFLPFLTTLIGEEESTEKKWYIKWIYSVFPDITDLQILFVFAIGIILIYVIKNLLGIYCGYLQSKFSSAFQKEASVKMISSYLKRPYEFFVNTNSNIIFRGIQNDTASVFQVIVNMMQIAAEAVMIVLIGLFLFVTDWFISVCALGLALVCFLSIVLGFKNKVKRIGQEYRDIQYIQGESMHQAINGIKEIMVLDRKEFFINKYESDAEAMSRVNTKKGVIEACPDRIIEGICISGLMIIICFRIMIGADMAEFLPVMGTFAMGAFKILPSFSKISSRVNNIVYFQEGLHNCYEQMKEARELEKQEQKDTEKVEARLKETDEKLTMDDIRFKEVVTVNNITWKYENSEDNILDNLSIEIHKGDSVAFIGSSGAGKSTLADIIMGLFKPQKGTVEMDGIDVFSMPHNWAKIIGYVPQSVYLIDDTVSANVAFGIEEDEIDMDKVWKALEQAQLADFVRSLPNGINTIVGERGVKFSGGQRQRIAIARALYTDPDIIVFDEATSALDTETEAAVMDSIEALQGIKTLIIIAHRLTTIRNCDKVYEIGEKVAKVATNRN